jgi:hypothetical protein
MKMSKQEKYEWRKRWIGPVACVRSQAVGSKREGLRLMKSFEDVALIAGQELVDVKTGAVVRSYGMETA